MRLTSTIFLLSLAIALNLFVPLGNAAQDDEALWLTALDKFNQGDYENAVTDLKGIIDSKQSSYESSAQLLLGKCYLELKKWPQAEAEAKRLMKKFPGSRYVADAYYVRAEALYRQKQYTDAAKDLLSAYQIADKPELKYLTREKLLGIFANYFKPSEQRDFMMWVEADELRSDLESIMGGYRPKVKIGVLLDLSGINAQDGKAMLEGIKGAFEQERSQIPHDIELVVYDTRSRVITALQMVKRLIHEDDVVAVIGGNCSPCAAAIAAYTAEYDIPYIIPSVQEQQITQFGNNIFQLSTDYYTEGQIAANYVFHDLETKSAVILAPATDSGSERAEGFQERFEALSESPVYLQWYYPEATSFKRQLDNLIQMGADSLAVIYELDDEQVEELMDWDKDEEPEKKVSDLFTIFEEDTTLVDSLLELYGSPINFFDVLYIPVEGKEISLITPQIAAAGFDGIILGDSDCLYYVKKESDWRYVEGIVFPSHFATDELSTLHTKIANVENLLPGHLFGWDAFEFLAIALKQNDSVYPPEIIKALGNIEELETDRLTLYFPDDSRTNQAMHILTFHKGKFDLALDAKSLIERP